MNNKENVQPLATLETASSFNVAGISQKQLLRLQLAAQILSGVIVGNDVLWCKDPDAGYVDDEEMVDKAIKCADLLLKKITEAAE